MRELSRWFKALSEDTRLRILALMFRYGELCVCEVERLLGLSQSTASRHLRYLLHAGIVEDRREGLWIYYGIAEPSDEGRATLLAALERALADVPASDASRELAGIRAKRCVPDSRETVPVDLERQELE